MSIEPVLREGFLKDLVAMLTAKLKGQRISANMYSNEVLQSCLNCTCFDENNEICNKYKQRPPARVIAFSCPSYEDNDDIPF